MRNEDNVVDQRTTTGQVIDSFVILPLQNLHILLTISQQTQIRASVQFKYSFSLQLHFVQSSSWQKLALLLYTVVLLPVDQVVGELLETNTPQTN